MQCFTKKKTRMRESPVSIVIIKIEQTYKSVYFAKKKVSFDVTIESLEKNRIV